MYAWAFLCCFLLLACNDAPKEAPVSTTTTREIPVTENHPALQDTVESTAADTTTDIIPVVQPTKKPSGVYRFLLPYQNDEKILHTIAFYPGRFRLQEEYGRKRDSVVVTEGTWASSQGFIWLYREQVQRGRYTWKGDTLQYYSPRLTEKFPMEKLTPVTANEVWQTKKKAGSRLYATGTEPFWNIEINSNDTVVMNTPEWAAPVRLKMTAVDAGKDSTVYTAQNDSLQLTVYPYFCSDGMSDFLYTQRVKVLYKGQLFRGCAETFRTAH